MAIRQLSTLPDQQLQDEFAAQDVVVLYKHSPTCGLCDIAMDEVNAFVASNPDVPVWMVDVLAQRPLSQRLEAMLGVEHESPQVIVVQRGAPVWNASHRRVTRARMQDAMTALPG
jgi:bacillithiol system protein YtxJ